MGALMLLVALLRLLQGETGAFDGNLSWIPYLIVTVVAVGVDRAHRAAHRDGPGAPPAPAAAEGERRDAQRRHVERAEVEASLRDLFGEGEQTARQYAGVTAGTAGAVGFLALVFAFLVGRRKGRRRSAVVEIRSR